MKGERAFGQKVSSEFIVNWSTVSKEFYKNCVPALDLFLLSGKAPQITSPEVIFVMNQRVALLQHQLEQEKLGRGTSIVAGVAQNSLILHNGPKESDDLPTGDDSSLDSDATLDMEKFDHFCRLLTADDPFFVLYSLKGIEQLLKDAQEERVRDSEIAIKLAENGSLDKIENLQHHPNLEIYEKSLNIIGTYFAEE
jgi:hypothetical protein